MTKGHVRCFDNNEDIKKRYGKYIDISSITMFRNVLYLFVGIIK
jgi:hypothetical protein